MEVEAFTEASMKVEASRKLLALSGKHVKAKMKKVSVEAFVKASEASMEAWKLPRKLPSTSTKKQQCKKPRGSDGSFHGSFHRLTHKKNSAGDHVRGMLEFDLPTRTYPD